MEVKVVTFSDYGQPRFEDGYTYKYILLEEDCIPMLVLGPYHITEYDEEREIYHDKIVARAKEDGLIDSSKHISIKGGGYICLREDKRLRKSKRILIWGQSNSYGKVDRKLLDELKDKILEACQKLYPNIKVLEIRG